MSRVFIDNTHIQEKLIWVEELSSEFPTSRKLVLSEREGVGELSEKRFPHPSHLVTGTKMDVPTPTMPPRSIQVEENRNGRAVL